MSTNFGQQVYAQGAGTASTALFDAVRLPRNPTTGDNSYQLGKFWVNTITNAVWYLSSYTGSSSGNSANWANLSAGSIAVGVLTIDNIFPDGGGNFTIESTNGSIGIVPVANGINLFVASTPTLYQGNSGGTVAPNPVTQVLTISGSNSTGLNVVGNVSPYTLTVSAFTASISQQGTLLLATNAQAIAGIDAANAVTSAALSAKLGTQTANSLAIFEGSSSALTALGAGTNGQLPIGSTGSDPVLSTLTAGTGISITNGAGSITIAVSGSMVVETLTGNTGGAISPTAGNINTLGTGSITIVGSGSTLTTQMTGLTNHAVLVGAGTATITKVGPTSTSGQVLQSQGSASDPAFSTATYPSTTTINQILYSSAANTVLGLATVNNGVLTTGTSGTPVVTSLASNGQLIIGSGSGAPSAATLTAGTGISITNGANSISIAVSGSVVGQTITGNSGGALSPTAGNWNILGASTASGTSPVTTSGSVSTLTINVQKSQAIAATDATKVGLSNFDSGSFSVDANGFVTASGTGIIKTLTGNSGGAISPTTGNINTLGTGSITIAGAGSTLTTQLTGLTNHNVLVGAGTATITNVSPSATSGVPLISQGASADPSFGTAVVAGGGTGITSATAYAVLCGGTTSTGAFQSIAGVGTSGQVLTSNGAGALPTFQAVGAGTFVINIQTFTSSGTYTPTSGMVYCVIEAVGGGGGGGGAAGVATTYSGGGGGGGGGYARKFASAATIGVSQTVTVGAAGSAGSSGNNAGGNGGDSSLGTICIGKGGSGGAGQSSNIANGGAGGVAGTGDLTFPGVAGPCSIYILTSGGVGSTTAGGGSYFGAGGVAVTAFNSSTTGTAGSLYGGGGGGGGSFNAGAAAGGAGAKGVVIVTEYIT